MIQPGKKKRQWHFVAVFFLFMMYNVFGYFWHAPKQKKVFYEELKGKIIMKILFIFTGGTIGSTTNDKFISLDGGKPYKIISAYKEKFGIDFTYDTVEPYTLLSENSMGSNLKLLADSVIEGINKDYDGIIVTHGTDTLQYSGAFLSYIAGLSKTPVFLVSSDHPVEDERANGLYNLDGAVAMTRLALADKSIKGVYIPYRNSDAITYIHRASRLLMSQAYTADMFSVKNSFFAKYENGHLIKNDLYQERIDEASALLYTGLLNVSDSIVRIEACPGLKYPEIDERVKAVIIGTYHSGTLPMETEELKSFLTEMKERNIDVFITGVSSGISYESTKDYQLYDLKIFPEISPIAAYIKLWLLITMGYQNAELYTMLNLSLGGDIV